MTSRDEQDTEDRRSFHRPSERSRQAHQKHFKQSPHDVNDERGTDGHESLWPTGQLVEPTITFNTKPFSQPEIERRAATSHRSPGCFQEGRAGLEGWRPHDLWHFFVTELSLRRGASAHAVQALAGHANLATTERYAHVVRPDLEAVIARLTAP